MKNSFIFLVAIICLPFVTNAQSQNWTQLDDFDGLGRIGAFSFVINNKGYFGSGQLSDGTLRKDFWEYDPATDTWLQKEDASGIPRSFAVGFAIGSKGYMGTGEIGGSPNFVSSNDFYEYDPVTNVWTIRQSVGLTGRREGTSFVIGNKGYVTLGYRDVLTPPSNWDKTTYEFDPATGLWTQKADFDTNRLRAMAAGFSVNGKGYIAGGYHYTHPNYTMRRDIQELDPVSNTWTLKNSYPSNFEINSTVGFSSGNFGYIVGNDIWNDGIYLNVLKYDPANNTFTVIPKFNPGTVFAFSGLTLCESAYTVAGSGSNSKQVWRYFLPDLSINGQSVICPSGNSYSIDNLPGTLSVSWQATPSNLFAVSSGTGSSANLTPASSSSVGQGTLTFTINNSCGTPITSVKSFSVYGSSPFPTGIDGPNYNLCRIRGQNNGSGDFYVHDPQPNVIYQFQVVKSNGQSEPIVTADFITLEGFRYAVGTHTLRLRSQVCGLTSSWYNSSFVVVNCPAGFAMSVSPNPASSELNISFEDAEQQTALKEAFDITLTNSSQEKVYSIKTTNLKTKIPINTLPEGMYFLNVSNKEGTIQRRILIDH